jgi:hypothetical protein
LSFLIALFGNPLLNPVARAHYIRKIRIFYSALKLTIALFESAIIGTIPLIAATSIALLSAIKAQNKRYKSPFL